MMNEEIKHLHNDSNEVEQDIRKVEDRICSNQ